MLYPLITACEWQGEKAQRGVHFSEGKCFIELACYTATHFAKQFTPVSEQCHLLRLLKVASASELELFFVNNVYKTVE